MIKQGVTTCTYAPKLLSLLNDFVTNLKSGESGNTHKNSQYRQLRVANVVSFYLRIKVIACYHQYIVYMNCVIKFSHYF